MGWELNLSPREEQGCARHHRAISPVSIHSFVKGESLTRSEEKKEITAYFRGWFEFFIYSHSSVLETSGKRLDNKWCIRWGGGEVVDYKYIRLRQGKQEVAVWACYQEASASVGGRASFC